MISTCEPYRQSEQKRCEKFCGPKEQKAPGLAKKGETGCFLGAGGDENGWGRVQPDEKTQCPNQSEHHSRATQAKRKPAKTQCFRRFLAGAEGLGSSAGSGAAPRWGAAPTGAGAKAGAVACVPPARTAPSARGFGVDVGTLYRERGRAGVAQFLPQVPGRVVLFWCCERLWQQFFKFFTHSASFENPTPLLGGFCCWKAPGGTHSGPRG